VVRWGVEGMVVRFVGSMYQPTGGRIAEKKTGKEKGKMLVL
jgi:hypothetical protein